MFCVNIHNWNCGLVFQEHFMEVVCNQEFLQLSADEVAKLLASDDLNVPSEEAVFLVSHQFFD